MTETSGFCSQYCGWHSSASGYKFAFVGVPPSSCTGCYAQSSSPNGDAGIDGAVSVVAHELAEAATNPLGTGWYFQSKTTYVENCDQCAWNFPDATYVNGYKYNIVVGEKNYLIQSNWNLNTKTCTMS